jgi:hypothetical protein
LALQHLGAIAAEQEDLARAAKFLKESAALSQKAGDRQGLADGLEVLAGVMAAPGRAEHAAHLFAAAAALRDAIGAPPRAAQQDAYDRHLAATRAALSDDAFAAAWDRGRSLPFHEVVADAVAAVEVTPAPSPVAVGA